MYSVTRVKFETIVVTICITLISIIAFHFGEIVIVYIGLSSLTAYLLGRFHKNKGGECITQKHTQLLKKYLTEVSPETKKLVEEELGKRIKVKE